MGTITISVDDEVESIFRIEAGRAFSGRKGFLGDAITDAMKGWLDSRAQSRIAKEEIVRMRRGYRMGGFTFKDRDELHER